MRIDGLASNSTIKYSKTLNINEERHCHCGFIDLFQKGYKGVH